MSAVLAPRAHVERTKFERRDERITDWLADVDRRHGPRRFEEVEAARVDDLEQGGSGRVTVADRNPTLHPMFAGICEGFSL